MGYLNHSWRWVAGLILPLLIHTACNNLTVFINASKSKATFEGAKSVTVTAEGNLSVSWEEAPSSPRSKNTYLVYLLKLKELPSSLKVSSALNDKTTLTENDSLVSNSFLENDPASSAFTQGSLVGTIVDGTSFIYDQGAIDPSLYYIFEVKLSTVQTKSSKNRALLSKVNFDPPRFKSITPKLTNLSVNWEPVAGALEYELFESAQDSLPLIVSDVPSIDITYLDAAVPHDYCVRAKRGALRSKECFPIDGIGRSWHPKILGLEAALQPQYYTVGDPLRIVVRFSNPVSMTQGAQSSLLLNLGAERNANYVSGSGSSELIYEYRIQPGDNTAALNVGSRLEVSSENTLHDGAGRSADVNIGKSERHDLHRVKVDTLPPTPPGLVQFQATHTNDTAILLNWIGGADQNLSGYDTRLCSTTTCDSGCGPIVMFQAPPAHLTGSDGANVYGCVQTRDESGLTSAWVSSAAPLVVDTTRALISSVDSMTADGFYGNGVTLNIAIHFSEVVFVTGPASLLLNSTPIARTAAYVTGSGTDTLNFAYTVGPGDTAADLDYATITALTTSGAIRDAAGNNANLVLPAPGSLFSLAGQKAIVIDTTPPLSSTPPTFSTAMIHTTNVAVLGLLSTDSNLHHQNVKLCELADCATHCTVESQIVGSSATLTGTDGSGYFACVQGVDKVGLHSGWTASVSRVVIDSTPPKITDVTSSSEDGYYKLGGHISIAITFDENVIVTNPNALTLALNSGSGHAVYIDGNGTNILSFEYEVLSGQNAADLNYSSATALSAGAGSIQDAAGNNANLTLPDPAGMHSIAGQKSIVIDTTSPLPPTSAILGSAFSNVNSVPVSWSAGSDINFKQYNARLCRTADCETTCADITSSATLSATVLGYDTETYHACVQTEDKSGNTSTWAASSGTVTIDGSHPNVLQVSSPKANDIYTTGELIPIHVKFSEVVDVINGANLHLSLETGTTDRELTYGSGSGSDTLVFNFTAQAGDSSQRLDYHSVGALGFTGAGSVRDAAGNDADLNLPGPGLSRSLSGQKNFRIDTTSPTAPTSVGFHMATSGSTQIDLSWGPGFDANVKQYNAKLCQQNDCSSLCTVASTTVTTEVVLTGADATTYHGCVQTEDEVGLKSPWAASLQTVSVDTSIPRVMSVTSTSPNGAYKIGTVHSISVTFSENVYGTNLANLTLALETGIVDRNASYVSGNGTSTFVFTYTVQAGDQSGDLSYNGPNALTLGTGATLVDSAGNAAVVTLPTPGDALSLSGQKNIVIDTVSPIVTLISPAANSAVGASFTFTLSCEVGSSIFVTGGVLNPLNALLCATGTLTRTVYLSDIDGTKTINFAAVDAATNSAASSLNVIRDTTPPVVTQTALNSPLYSNTQTIVMGGSCESGINVTLEVGGITEGTTACTNASWSYETAIRTTDATRGYTITQTDALTNVGSTNFIWIRDSATPNFAFRNQSITISDTVHANTYTFTGSCDSASSTLSQSITVSGPGIGSSDALICTAGSWSYAAPSQSNNGSYSYVFTQTDIAGNSTILNGTWIRAASGPLLTVLNPLIKSNQNTATFTGVCDPAYPITVSGANSPVAPTCPSSGLWTFVTPTMTTENTHAFTLTQTSNLGDSTTISLSFLRATTPPSIATFDVNNGSVETGAYRVLLNMTTSSQLVAVTKVCFIQAVWASDSTSPTPPTPPSASDPCWQTLSGLGLSASRNVSISGLPFILNLTVGKYSIYAYAGDEVGNISANSNTEGQNRATIKLVLPIPPTLKIAAITNIEEVTTSDFAAGDELDIHWSITGGTQIASAPVSVRWSVDDKNWNLLATNLSDGAHDCAKVTGATGCYRLTIPTSSFMRLQLEVKNTANNSFFLESTPLNTGGRLRSIVGRTFKGINGTSRGYQLTYSHMTDLRFMNIDNFVVTREGVIYVIDDNLGILKVDPKDQIVRVAYPRGSYGTDGAIGARAFVNPTALSLDTKRPLQRLWINDNGILRSLDFNTNQAKTYSSHNVSGASWRGMNKIYSSKFGIYGKAILRLADGNDRYLPFFLNEVTGKLEFYRFDGVQNMPFNASTAYAYCESLMHRGYPVFTSEGVVTQWVGGLINGGSVAQQNCRGNSVWNVTEPTSRIGSYAGQEGGASMPASMPLNFANNYDSDAGLGLDGRIYASIRQGYSGIIRYEATSNSWNKILGLDNTTAVKQASCPDDSLAKECDVDLNSMFVDESGTLYFMDAGRIRVVDASGKIHTIFGTTIRTVGTNLNATDTVLGGLEQFQRRVTSDDKEEVSFMHYSSLSYRKVMDGKLDLLAGNGEPWNKPSTIPAAGVAPGLGTPFAMDSDGNLYTADFASNSRPTVFKLNRSTNTWSIFIPWTCTGCTGVASSIFDPADASFSSASRPVQLDSGVTGMQAPFTSGSSNYAKPLVLGINGGSLLIRSMDVAVLYTGASNGTFVNGASYATNVMISEFPIESFSTNTVTKARRILGKQGASMNSSVYVAGSVNTVQSLGVFSPLPPMGLSANQFEVSTVGNPIGPQWYEGAYYLRYGNFATKLLKVTPAAVTNPDTLNLNLMAFALARESDDDILYYCTSAGLLKRRSMTTFAETTLNLVIPGATCDGQTMLYYTRDNANYLMFIYTQNGLSGIAELKVSP